MDDFPYWRGKWAYVGEIVMETLERKVFESKDVIWAPRPHLSLPGQTRARVATFIDEENLRLGMPKKKGKFNPRHILDYVRLNIGIPTINKIYLHGSYDRPLSLKQSRDNDFEVWEAEDNGKNAADLALFGDAVETMCWNEYITTFVIVSGDKDLTQLIKKLHWNGKNIIVIAHRNCTSAKYVELVEHLGHQFIDYSSIIGRSN